MSQYLLDTDICVYAMKALPAVQARLAGARSATIAISVVTESELRTGVEKSRSPVRNRRALETFLKSVRTLPFESADAIVYAQVRAHLEKAGTPIGALDTLIGAHAVARGRVLVTNNESEFKRIRGLKIENWTK